MASKEYYILSLFLKKKSMIFVFGLSSKKRCVLYEGVNKRSKTRGDIYRRKTIKKKWNKSPWRRAPAEIKFTTLFYKFNYSRGASKRTKQIFKCCQP